MASKITDLTKDNVADPTAQPGLLDQVDCPIDRFLADGAYDGEPTSDLLAARFDRRSRSLSHLPEMRSRAPVRPTIRRHATELLHSSRPAERWQGRRDRATISGAAAKRKWVAGSPSSGPNLRRVPSKIRKQKPGLAFGFSTG